MKKARMVSSILSIVGIMMISIALIIENDNTLSNTSIPVEDIDFKNIAASTNMLVKNSEEVENSSEQGSLALKEVSMEVVPASVVIPPRIEVHDGLTMEEITNKFNRLLGTSYLQGKGYLIGSYAINNGVDPYIALAIILHETGCGGNNSCSKLTMACNNVGGQKGSPGCNGGAYKAFATLDEGIVGFIDNLYKNYFGVGLTTVDTIAPRYAESPSWPAKIHWYVEKIKNTSYN